MFLKSAKTSLNGSLALFTHPAKLPPVFEKVCPRKFLWKPICGAIFYLVYHLTN